MDPNPVWLVVLSKIKRNVGHRDRHTPGSSTSCGDEGRVEVMHP